MSVATLSGRSVTSSTARSWRSSVVASRYKAASLRDLATKTLDGTVVLSPHGLSRLSDEEVKARLTAVRGIGPWTADMFLLFQLRWLDVWPTGLRCPARLRLGVGDSDAERQGTQGTRRPLPAVPVGRRLVRWRAAELYAAAYSALAA